MKKLIKKYQSGTTEGGMVYPTVQIAAPEAWVDTSKPYNVGNPNNYELKTTVPMPKEWKGNKEMQLGTNESDNDYIERMSRLNADRYKYMHDVLTAQDEAGQIGLETVKGVSYFVPGIGNVVLTTEILTQLAKGDYTGAATNLAAIAGLKYGIPVIASALLKAGLTASKAATVLKAVHSFKKNIKANPELELAITKYSPNDSKVSLDMLKYLYKHLDAAKLALDPAVYKDAALYVVPKVNNELDYLELIMPEQEYLKKYLKFVDILKGMALDVGEKNGYTENNFKFFGDDRFYLDMQHNRMKEFREMRELGQYPLTFPERREWVNNVKNDVQNGYDYVLRRAELNPSLTGLTSLEQLDLIQRLDQLFVDGEITWEEYLQGMSQSFPDNKNLMTYYKIQHKKDPAKLHFGTREAINTYDDTGDYPIYNGYLAFARPSSGNIYFPFRVSDETLQVNPSLYSQSTRLHVGGHEGDHIALALNKVPLVVKTPKFEGEYGEYVNLNLDPELKDLAQKIIDKAGTAGTWEGSLEEMDAELKGWLAEKNVLKFTELSPADLQYIVDLANNRFKLSNKTDFTSDALKVMRPAGMNTNTFIRHNLEFLPFYKLFTTLEKSGYKSGGKILIKKKNRGKFTDYCGGKVTDECIQRAKHSNNKQLVKRAVFALNARKWNK